MKKEGVEVGALEGTSTSQSTRVQYGKKQRKFCPPAGSKGERRGQERKKRLGRWWLGKL